MRICSNCGKTHGPLKRYMWNTYTKKLNIAESHEGLLCKTCAKHLGAWQLLGKEEEEIITTEDIERLEREEKYSSLN